MTGGWEGGGVWTALRVVRLRVLEFEINYNSRKLPKFTTITTTTTTTTIHMVVHST